MMKSYPRVERGIEASPFFEYSKGFSWLKIYLEESPNLDPETVLNGEKPSNIF